MFEQCFNISVKAKAHGLIFKRKSFRIRKQVQKGWQIENSLQISDS